MATFYFTSQERASIKRRADAGDTSAQDYLELLDALTQVLESSNGISLACGLVVEHNDVYFYAIDDALSELMLVILKVTAGGWESLKWYAPDDSTDPISGPPEE